MLKRYHWEFPISPSPSFQLFSVKTSKILTLQMRLPNLKIKYQTHKVITNQDRHLSLYTMKHEHISQSRVNVTSDTYWTQHNTWLVNFFIVIFLVEHIGETSQRMYWLYTCPRTSLTFYCLFLKDDVFIILLNAFDTFAI